ncbi:MAG: radical SAM protein [Myxococcales bacterium]
MWGPHGNLRALRREDSVRYQGQLYRPPSEADAYILQATIGCSWNACVYCDMYRDKDFSVRPLAESLEDLDEAARRFGSRVRKVFVADGDALILPVDHWLALLQSMQRGFAHLERVSCYAMARNVLAKSDEELRQLREAGLTRLYIGPESGDDVTLKRIAKGSTFAEHVEAAQRAHAAGMEISVITMLGVAGVERSAEHAARTAELVTAMDPEFLAALTTTVVPSTPLATLRQKGKFVLPSLAQMFGELRTIVHEARPRRALFRTNHASNYLPLAGVLPEDRERIVATIDAALAGEVALRPEWSRGL